MGYNTAPVEYCASYKSPDGKHKLTLVDSVNHIHKCVYCEESWSE